MKKLALEIIINDGRSLASRSTFAVLAKETSITVNKTSEIFDSGTTWSFEFPLNVEDNIHIFGSAADCHGERLHNLIKSLRARLWVAGNPMFLGVLRLQDEAELDKNGNVNVRLESGRKTFEEQIEGGKANQVPLMGDVEIGRALWRYRKANYSVEVAVTPSFDETTITDGYKLRFASGTKTFSVGMGSGNRWDAAQKYPRMVFPKGELDDNIKHEPETFNFVNTDTPYDASHPYCNIALCYQKHGFPQREDGTTDYSSEPVKLRGYEVMPANRVNSAPCFYVLYWLNALFKHLGIHIAENQLLQIEDFRRLFFVNTKCAIEEPSPATYQSSINRYGRFLFKDAQKRWIAELTLPTWLMDPNETHLKITDFYVHYSTIDLVESVPEIKGLTIQATGINRNGEDAVNTYQETNRRLYRAYATSECFPDEDISKVIDMLRNAFGVRFIFDDNCKTVRIVLLRNILRGNKVQRIKADVIGEPTRIDSAIRGFRMTYGAGTEDTHFYYKPFDRSLDETALWKDKPDEHDYSKFDTQKTYADLLSKVSAFDTTCYYDKTTGNAYGIKVDKDAKRYDELHPSLFEYAGYRNAEDGDCTGEASTIHEINVGFTPAIMNDVNMEAERAGQSKEQRFALFVDEEMKPRRFDFGDLPEEQSYNDPDVFYDVNKLYDSDGIAVKEGKTWIAKPGAFSLFSDMEVDPDNNTLNVPMNVVFSWETADGGLIRMVDASYNVDMTIGGSINEGYRLYLQDNFEPNDDGISPIEKHKWGLTLGIMRGSGSDARIDYEYDAEEGEENDTWDIVQGSNATSHPDTCDCYGNQWDYNGGVVVENSADAQAAIRSSFREYSVAILENRKSVKASEVNEAGFNYDFPNDNYDVPYLFDSVIVMDAESGTHTTIYYTPLAPANINILSIMSKRDCENALKLAYGDSTSDEADTARNIVALRKMVICWSDDEWYRLAPLLLKLYGLNAGELYAPNGIGEGERFSLKLRAEKPYIDGPKDDEYQQIETEKLKKRGLADKFYTEFSDWIRHADTISIPTNMEIAELLALDMTQRATINGVTGFIKKIQYTANIDNGLENVIVELMYLR